MKTFTLTAVAMTMVLSLNSFAVSKERSKIRWGNNLTEAFEEAKKTGKPIVVFFRRDTSEPLSEGHNGEVVESMAYERTVLADRMVQGHHKDFLFVKLMPADLKPKSYEETMAKALKIEKYPVLAVLEVSNGQLVLRGTASGAVNFRNQQHYPVLKSLRAAMHGTEAFKKAQAAHAAAASAPAKPATTTPSGSKATTPAQPDAKPSSK